MLKNILKITVRAKIFTIAKRYFRAKFKVLQSIGKYGHVEPGLGATKSYPAFLIDLYICSGRTRLLQGNSHTR